jgi:hypothetical protein
MATNQGRTKRCYLRAPGAGHHVGPDRRVKFSPPIPLSGACCRCRKQQGHGASTRLRSTYSVGALHGWAYLGRKTFQNQRCGPACPWHYEEQADLVAVSLSHPCSPCGFREWGVEDLTRSVEKYFTVARR